MEEPNPLRGRKAATAVSATLLTFLAFALILCFIGSDSQRSDVLTTMVASSGRAKATQSLVDYMKDKSLAHVPMLSDSEVKRAIVCPTGKKCSFKSESGMKVHSEVARSKKDGKMSDSQADIDGSMETYFDVFETSAVGCVHGHAAFELNFTKVVTGPQSLRKSQDGASEDEDLGKSSINKDKDGLTMLHIHPFYVVQDLQTGRYVDYVAPRGEKMEIVNMKRGLMDSLNPVIHVTNEDRAIKMEDGAMLFQLTNKGMNGIRQTAYRLLHDANRKGSHKTEHLTTILEGSAGGDVPHGDEECPFPTKNVETFGVHHGTVETSEDSLSQSDEKGDVKLGKDADSLSESAPNKHAAEDEEETGEEPVTAEVRLEAMASVQKMTEVDVEAVCSASLSPKSLNRASLLSLAEWQTKVPPAEDDSAGHNRQMVRRSAASPALSKDWSQDYDTSPKVVQEAKRIVSLAAASEAGVDESRLLHDGCHHGAVRRQVLQHLRDTAVPSEERLNVAVRFLGACGTSINSKGTQEDVTDLAANSGVDGRIREQALWTMPQVKCPLPSTLDKIHKLSQADTMIGRSALLALGSLLKNSRTCSAEATQDHRDKLAAMEQHIDHTLHHALREGKDSAARTALYAMSNSGGDSHKEALRTAVLSHSSQLRTISLQSAAIDTVQRLAMAQTGTEEGSEAHKQLLVQLSTPLSGEDVAGLASVHTAGNSTSLATAAATTDLSALTQSCDYEGYGNLFCWGKRLPQHSFITLSIDGGMGIGKGYDSIGACVNYAQSSFKLSTTIDPGIGIDYLDPLAFDLFRGDVQMFFDKNKKAIGGQIRVLGYTVASLGDTFSAPYSENRPTVGGARQAVDDFTNPHFTSGYCRIWDSTERGGVYRKDIRHNYMDAKCRKETGRDCEYYVSGIKVYYDGHYILETTTKAMANMQDYRPAWTTAWQCSRGEHNGQLKLNAKLRFDISGGASIEVLRGELKAEITILDINSENTASLLYNGYGKESDFWINGGNGRIFIRLEYRSIRCWGPWYWPDCEWSWSHLWEQTLWSWSGGHIAGNPFCDGRTTLGCKMYTRSLSFTDNCPREGKRRSANLNFKPADWLGQSSLVSNGGIDKRQLVSINGMCSAVVQQDCNFVVYKKGYSPVWQTRTSGWGSGPCSLTVQSSGDLVLTDRYGRRMWHTGTRGSNPYLLLRDDCELWMVSSGRVSWRSRATTAVDATTRPPPVLRRGGYLLSGQPADKMELEANNGACRLVMQADCNLVLYLQNGHPQWKTNTGGPGPCKFVLQTDGNLVVYNGHGGVVWSPNIDATEVRLQDDCNLVATNRYTVRWASGPMWRPSFGAPVSALALIDGGEEFGESEECEYDQAGAYRGDVAVAGDGSACLPWPKGSAVRYYGTGLLAGSAEDACPNITEGSNCWEACIYAHELNNFCRDPTDRGVPYCRTGGTDDAPLFSDCTQLRKCTAAQMGCTHNEKDGSDYQGPLAKTVSGKTCDPWMNHAGFAKKAEEEQWHNFCRNPNGQQQPWCFVQGTDDKEECDIGPICAPPPPELPAPPEPEHTADDAPPGPIPLDGGAEDSAEEGGESHSESPPPFQH